MQSSSSSSGAYEKVNTQSSDAAADDNDTPLLSIPAPEEAMNMTVAVASLPTIQVSAPADLPEGYEFQATLGGGTNDGNGQQQQQQRTIKVTVPPGGVEKGQTFSVPLQPTEMDFAGVAGSSGGNTISIPVGHWRDGLFEFYKYGICHPHCWTSCCCTTLAAGQVISRLKLRWNGKPAESVAQSAGAFPIIFGIVLLYYAVRCGLSAAIFYIDPTRALTDPDNMDDLPPPSSAFVTVMVLIDLWFYSFWVVLAIILYNTRRTTREMYGIPANFESEDCLVSTFCPCFAAGQLLRHTTEYDIYPATCCTERGIPPHAPSIV